MTAVAHTVVLAGPATSATASPITHATTTVTAPTAARHDTHQKDPS